MSEGSLHSYVKNEIAHDLACHEEVRELELERPFALATSRDHHLHLIQPDVTFRLHGYRVAVEVQRSQQTWEEIAERTECYHELGIFVLWILLHEENMWEGRRTLIPEWEQGVHALYYGIVYLWLKEATVLPVHLQPCPNHTGKRRQGDRLVNSLSLRKRYPWFLSPVQITDLHPEIRAQGRYGRYPLPAAHLWSLPYAIRQQALEATHSFLDIRTSLYRVRNGLDGPERWKTQ
jgi:hypothetical protein